MQGIPHTRPPEGVLSGESIPVENQEEDFDMAAVRLLMNKLKTRGEPYTKMKEAELREKAEELLHKYGGGVDY